MVYSKSLSNLQYRNPRNFRANEIDEADTRGLANRYNSRNTSLREENSRANVTVIGGSVVKDSETSDPAIRGERMVNKSPRRPSERSTAYFPEIFAAARLGN